MEKPDYSVPSMAEIAAVPWNGLTVASAFSGCGGSCLGYRMAGYRVVWANDCDPAVIKSYRLNHLNTHLDIRPIQEIRGKDVLTATGLARGDLDLLDGSPPCTVFSTAGKRAKKWGKAETHAGKIQTTDDLFFEYARLVDDLQPRVFVAENVSGLIKGVAKGYFKMILARLKECGYRVEARLLDAQWLGVPQARQRIIFVGVRDDLNLSPAFPIPLSYRYTVVDACPWIHRGRFGRLGWRNTNRPPPTVSAQMTYNPASSNQGLELVEADVPVLGKAIGLAVDKLYEGEQSEKYFQLVRADRRKPSPTVTAMGGNPGMASVIHPVERRKFTIPELRRICAFPDDFELVGSYTEQWARLGNSVPPVMMRHIAETIRNKVLLPSRAKQG